MNSRSETKARRSTVWTRSPMTAHPSPDDDTVHLGAPSADRPDRSRVLLVDASDRGGIARYTRCLRDALAGRARRRGSGRAGRRRRSRPRAARARGGGPTWPGWERSGSTRCAWASSARARCAPISGPWPGPAPTWSTSRPRWSPASTPLVLRRISRRVPVVLTIHDPVPARRRGPRRRRPGAAVAGRRRPHHPRRRATPLRGGQRPGRARPCRARRPAARAVRRIERAEAGPGSASTTCPPRSCSARSGRTRASGCWPRPGPRWPPPLPDARLLVVGEAYESADLTLLEACSGVEIRRGFVPEDDLDAWAAAADVLVLPYAVGSHSGVLHRGLAAGTPVLASPPLAEEVHRTGAGARGPSRPRRLGRGPGHGPDRDAPSPSPSPPPAGGRPGAPWRSTGRSWPAERGEWHEAGHVTRRYGRCEARSVPAGSHVVATERPRTGRNYEAWCDARRLKVGALVAAASTGHVLYPAWLAFAARGRRAARCRDPGAVAGGHGARRRLRRGASASAPRCATSWPTGIPARST